MDFFRITLNNGHGTNCVHVRIKKFVKKFFMSVPRFRASSRHGGAGTFQQFLIR